MNCYPMLQHLHAHQSIKLAFSKKFAHPLEYRVTQPNFDHLLDSITSILFIPMVDLDGTKCIDVVESTVVEIRLGNCMMVTLLMGSIEC